MLGLLVVHIEEMLLLVQVADGQHIAVGEGEVEDIQVFGHALLLARFGDNDDTTLHQIAQGDLWTSLAIFLTDADKCLVLEILRNPE